MEFSAFTSALPCRATKAIPALHAVGWAQILLAEHPSTGSLAGAGRPCSTQPLQRGKWGTGVKKANTEQLGKLGSLPQNKITLARSHTAQQQPGPGEESIMGQLKSSLQPGTTWNTHWRHFPGSSLISMLHQEPAKP